MTGTPSPLAELLADCDAHGIRLLLAGDGGLTIDAPQDALTPDLLARLKAHKAELLTLLLRPCARRGLRPRRRAGLDSARDRHEADLPMRFDHLAGRADSRRAIRPAGLRPLRAVHRISQFGTERILDIMTSIR